MTFWKLQPVLGQLQLWTVLGQPQLCGPVLFLFTFISLLWDPAAIRDSREHCSLLLHHLVTCLSLD